MHYYSLRPYRRTGSKSGETQKLNSLMISRFLKGFDNYWHQFGYEIAGPVCYAFAKWVSEMVQLHPDISGIAFVARDGWLLKKIYDMLPSASCKTAYVYASRLLERIYRKDASKYEYKNYFDSLDLGNGGIAVVDTVTTSFSSYKLIESVANVPIYGFYWAALLGSQQHTYNCISFQKGVQTIKCWNLMEFIMTSPESPIIGFHDMKPIYSEPTPHEYKRKELFANIEKGVLEFSADILREDPGFSVSNRTITQWVNIFLKHPSDIDREAFDDIFFSESADHSDMVYLDPFGERSSGLNFRRIRDRIWMVSMQHPRVYKVVHAGNAVRKRILTLLYSIKADTFDISNIGAMAQALHDYDVVSFDIFDTLLLRSCNNPSDVFQLVENRYGIAGFRERRIEAEESARLQPNRSNREVNIYDIYEQLSLDSPGISIPAQYEIDIEYEVCRANPVFLELCHKLQESQCTIIATSDMYLPGPILQELLRHCGYCQINRVFVSCDYGFGKRQGKLQKAIQAKLGQNLKYIHIGDNLLSDVQGSITAGWDAKWYKVH